MLSMQMLTLSLLASSLKCYDEGVILSGGVVLFVLLFEVHSPGHNSPQSSS